MPAGPTDVDTPTSEPELRRLMTAGLHGDEDAHRTVLTLVSGRLRAYFKTRLARIGRGAVEAEDLVQEVLIAVHTRRHTYDPSQLFTPWLYGIARYKLLDYLRRTRVSAHDVPVDQADDVMAHDDVGGVENTFDVEKMLAELPPKMGQAIRYVKLEGLSVSEAATRLGMSPSAVKVSVHRGLKTLARLIAKERGR
jgi:RNA polymerase sigma-70 factor (ECF subfamily)